MRFYRDREFPNMGIRAVAKEMGVSFAHLNKIERGLIPSMEYISKIAKAYNLTKNEEFEILVLANKIFEHPLTKDYFDQNPKKLEDLGDFFRKN